MTRRQDSKEPLLSVQQFNDLVNRGLWKPLYGLTEAYAKVLKELENEAFPPSEGLDRISTSVAKWPWPSIAWERKQWEHEQGRARAAVGYVRQAQKALRNAEKILAGEQVPQPSRTDYRATMSSAEFERIRKRHIQREEELRR